MDIELVQNILKYMFEHKEEPLRVFTILNGLKSEFNENVLAPVLESSLKEMQDNRYVYLAGGYWYLTPHGAISFRTRSISDNPYNLRGASSSDVNQFYVVDLEKHNEINSSLKFGFISSSLEFEGIKKIADINFMEWKPAVLTYIKTFVKEQLRTNPDIGSRESLAKDGYSFMMDWLPKTIKNDLQFPELIQWLRNKLIENGYGDVFSSNAEVENVSQDSNLLVEDTDENDGDQLVGPEGNPVREQSEIFSPNLNFEQNDIDYEKEQLINTYLEELHKAMQEHNTEKINKLKSKINELNSISSLKFSWQLANNELTEFEEALKRKNYSYVINSGNLIVNYQGDVNLYPVKLLPGNITFNNRGYLYLPLLTALPENIAFNSIGDTYLLSLRSLPSNIVFGGAGNIYLNSLNSLPENKYEVFKNGGKVQYNHGGSIFDPRERRSSLKFSQSYPEPEVIPEEAPEVLPEEPIEPRREQPWEDPNSPFRKPSIDPNESPKPKARSTKNELF